jgi:hypothetical protein
VTITPALPACATVALRAVVAEHHLMESNMSKARLVQAVVISMVAFGVGACAAQTGDASSEAVSNESSALSVVDPDGPRDDSDDATPEPAADRTSTVPAGAETLARTGIARWSLGRSKTSFFAYGHDRTGRTIQTLALTPLASGGVKLAFTTGTLAETVLVDKLGNVAKGKFGPAASSFRQGMMRDIPLHIGGTGTVETKSVFDIDLGHAIGCSAAIVGAHAACAPVIAGEEALPACIAATAAAVLACRS